MPVGNFLDVLGPPAAGLQRLSKLGGIHTWSSGVSSAAHHAISSTGFIMLASEDTTYKLHQGKVWISATGTESAAEKNKIT